MTRLEEILLERMTVRRWLFVLLALLVIGVVFASITVILVYRRVPPNIAARRMVSDLEHQVQGLVADSIVEEARGASRVYDASPEYRIRNVSLVHEVGNRYAGFVYVQVPTRDDPTRIVDMKIEVIADDRNIVYTLHDVPKLRSEFNTAARWKRQREEPERKRRAEALQREEEEKKRKTEQSEREEEERKRRAARERVYVLGHSSYRVRADDAMLNITRSVDRKWKFDFTYAKPILLTGDDEAALRARQQLLLTRDAFAKQLAKELNVTTDQIERLKLIPENAWESEMTVSDSDRTRIAALFEAYCNAEPPRSQESAALVAALRDIAQRCLEPTRRSQQERALQIQSILTPEQISRAVSRK